MLPFSVALAAITLLRFRNAYAVLRRSGKQQSSGQAERRRRLGAAAAGLCLLTLLLAVGAVQALQESRAEALKRTDGGLHGDS